ncbi:unnamed protein product [Gordionus sp. m RMFG-2023]
MLASYLIIFLLATLPYLSSGEADPWLNFHHEDGYNRNPGLFDYFCANRCPNSQNPRCADCPPNSKK